MMTAEKYFSIKLLFLNSFQVTKKKQIIQQKNGLQTITGNYRRNINDQQTQKDNFFRNYNEIFFSPVKWSNAKKILNSNVHATRQFHNNCFGRQLSSIHYYFLMLMLSDFISQSLLYRDTQKGYTEIIFECSLQHCFKGKNIESKNIHGFELNCVSP